MLAADKNPYILDQQGKELVLSDDAEKLKQLITSLPTNSRGDNLPLLKYPKLLNQTLKILDVPDKLVEAAGSICAAVINQSRGNSAVYLSLLADQNTDQILGIMQNNRRLKNLNDFEKSMAINLATFPARIAQILSRRALDDPRRTSQCALNQAGGFPNWEQSIINAFTAAQNTFG